LVAVGRQKNKKKLLKERIAEKDEKEKQLKQQQQQAKKPPVMQQHLLCLAAGMAYFACPSAAWWAIHSAFVSYLFSLFILKTIPVRPVRDQCKVGVSG